jgi:Zn-dependent M28 family amino/carboxypeptidase
VEALADDSTLGRDAPSPELEEVALYIQDLFAKAGLRPGGENGGWFQRFPIAGTTAPNVIGWVEGSDAGLRDEYVVYTAHFDHLGYAPKTAPGLDSVYNGADDNASGTAALLELAEAFGAMPVKPRRSVVFLAVSGEEDGLVGSNYYAAHPTFPMALARANVNMDMIGRNDPGLIQAIRGPVSTIAGTVADVAAASPALGLTVQDIEDLSLMQRSDVWAFYGSGVDAVFLHSGLHADYHQRTDEPQYLNYDKMERVTRLAYLAGVQAAGVPQ